MTRVLIVDDNVENRYLLRVLLQGQGHVVDEARHGAEALAGARLNPPDLIVSDLLMPVLDGYSLLRQWKADDRLKTIPFVVYTATYTDPRDERLAVALGADAFIMKPADPESLMACIGAVLESAKRGELQSAAPRKMEELVLLKEYNDVIVHKLEQKAQQLERTNSELLGEIAERKRAEEKLRESEERFRATFEQAAVGIAHVDADGRFLRVNDKLCGITGYPRSELLRLTFSELTVPEDRAENDDARRAMLAGAQTVYSSEKRYRRKNGGVFWGSLVTTLLRDRAGEPKYFISVIADITDRKKLEDQLRRSQKMEAVGRLAGGVAHDFNNLITIISGYCDQVLAQPGVSDGIRDSVKIIEEASGRAAALTRQLLGFSRQTMLQPRVLDLNAVVADTGKLLRRLIGEDIVFSTVLDPNLNRVKVDPGQLDQVLMNLAINARDAMPNGGRLTIETANVVLSDDYAAAHVDCSAGHHVMLAMTDSGCGMTPDVLANIFEPFFTTKEPGKGTGLGLAMVFGIVRQSGGCIHVYSEPGHGTTFKIYLPAVTEKAMTRNPAASSPVEQGTETILLVEDDEAVRGLALMILKMHGYKVIVATDGKDALRIIQNFREPIHLVLTDVVMPNVSGPELARRLCGQFPRIKVLFMSGYTDDTVVRHGLLEATVAFIQKPYTPLALVQKVRDVLDGRTTTESR